MSDVPLHIACQAEGFPGSRLGFFASGSSSKRRRAPFSFPLSLSLPLPLSFPSLPFPGILEGEPKKTRLQVEVGDSLVGSCAEQTGDAEQPLPFSPFSPFSPVPLNLPWLVELPGPNSKQSLESPQRV